VNDTAEIGIERGFLVHQGTDALDVPVHLADFGIIILCVNRCVSFSERNFVVVVQAVVLLVGDLDGSIREGVDLTLCEFGVKFGCSIIEEGATDLTTLGIEQIHGEHLTILTISDVCTHLAPGGYACLDFPFSVVGRDFTDGENVVATHLVIGGNGAPWKLGVTSAKIETAVFVL